MDECYNPRSGSHSGAGEDHKDRVDASQTLADKPMTDVVRVAMPRWQPSS